MTRTPAHRYTPFDDEGEYLEQFVARQRIEKADDKCCPKCQRGPIPGQFPCGRPGSCPNLSCAHRPRAVR